MHMLHAVNTSKRDRLPLSEFLPKWDREPEKPQAVEDMIEMAKRWTLLLGGTLR